MLGMPHVSFFAIHDCDTNDSTYQGKQLSTLSQGMRLSDVQT